MWGGAPRASRRSNAPQRRCTSLLPREPAKPEKGLQSNSFARQLQRTLCGINHDGLRRNLRMRGSQAVVESLPHPRSNCQRLLPTPPAERLQHCETVEQSRFWPKLPTPLPPESEWYEQSHRPHPLQPALPGTKPRSQEDLLAVMTNCSRVLISHDFMMLSSRALWFSISLFVISPHAGRDRRPANPVPGAFVRNRKSPTTSPRRLTFGIPPVDDRPSAGDDDHARPSAECSLHSYNHVTHNYNFAGNKLRYQPMHHGCDFRKSSAGDSDACSFDFLWTSVGGRAGLAYCRAQRLSRSALTNPNYVAAGSSSPRPAPTSRRR